MKKLSILGVPWSFVSNKKGVSLGPYAVCYTNIVARLQDLGVEVVCYSNMPSFSAKEEEAVFLNNDMKTITLKLNQLHSIMKNMLYQEFLPVVIGGDQFNAVGVLQAILAAEERPIIVWLDAHLNLTAKYNQENLAENIIASAFGNGPKCMAHLFNQLIKPEQLCILGTRRIGKRELALIQHYQIEHFSMTEIDHLGIQAVTDKLMAWINNQNKKMHIFLDIDAVDPEFTPGTNFVSPGGLYYHEINYLLSRLLAHKTTSSLTVTGINPLNDKQNKTAHFVTKLLENYFSNQKENEDV